METYCQESQLGSEVIIYFRKILELPSERPWRLPRDTHCGAHADSLFTRRSAH